MPPIVLRDAILAYVPDRKRRARSIADNAHGGARYLVCTLQIAHRNGFECESTSTWLTRP